VVEHPMESKNENEKRALIQMSKKDIRCNLRLAFIRMFKSAKRYSLGSKVVHVRNEEICRLHIEFEDLVEKGRYKISQFPVFLRSKSFKIT